MSLKKGSSGKGRLLRPPNRDSQEHIPLNSEEASLASGLSRRTPQESRTTRPGGRPMSAGLSGPLSENGVWRRENGENGENGAVRCSAMNPKDSEGSFRVVSGRFGSWLCSGCWVRMFDVNRPQYLSHGEFWQISYSSRTTSDPADCSDPGRVREAAIGAK